MHEPVLVESVVSLMQPRPDGVYVDCTVGLGGHTAALLAQGAGRVLGLDRDQAALSVAGERLASAGDRVDLVHADYRDLPRVLRERGVSRIDGALVDLGVSSMQLDDATRGFSFRQDGPLDMRMNPASGPTAADLIRDTDESALADVIYRFGEERLSRRIARAIVRARDVEPLTRTTQLASIVRRAAGGHGWQRIDPATRTFQALRIWVNGELEGLETFIDSAVETLADGGRLVMIAFQSLEDRIVKHTFRRLGSSPEAQASRGSGPTSTSADPRTPGPAVTILTRRPLLPSEDEVRRNPRARSARLRAVERLA